MLIVEIHLWFVLNITNMQTLTASTEYCIFRCPAQSHTSPNSTFLSSIDFPSGTLSLTLIWKGPGSETGSKTTYHEPVGKEKKYLVTCLSNSLFMRFNQSYVTTENVLNVLKRECIKCTLLFTRTGLETHGGLGAFGPGIFLRSGAQKAPKFSKFLPINKHIQVPLILIWAPTF